MSERSHDQDTVNKLDRTRIVEQEKRLLSVDTKGNSDSSAVVVLRVQEERLREE